MGVSKAIRHAAVALGSILASAAAQADRLCDGYGGLPPGPDSLAGMVRIEGGAFTMGDDDERPEERRAHPVTVSSFWIDRHEVTNAQFRRFVAATGYVTMAERGLDPKDSPGIPAELLEPGSIVFHSPEDLRDLADVRQWWRYARGANWRAPLGPGSEIVGKNNHPVIHVAYQDALAYAHWLGHDLPTEAEWEFAARGGLDGATYSWGDRYFDPASGWKANTWQGLFPVKDSADDGYHGTAPVGCFGPNGYGLFDMAGNVWEYTKDWYVPGHPADAATDPGGPSESAAARHAGAAGPSVVIKGGSWLCAQNFCARYRPSARQPQELSLGASHLGFRTVHHAPDRP
ncbi:formylglycine-generating enzyme family protein (plasmid) [Skermanella mucosa]|uniref:formylglycine-generating enzyme family protein n=1 Tax=Skermanella mucosa TaxID=1789672 RepID=UPI00192A87BA|nr:formylglycine-generating enzyme family protein [Skermanella mucosa]UEM24698.1 formylglycine-generating enzyme family protein [Skermanella mucosa]